jgi:sodium-dependent dicarboxylate transporter 2/3/5
MKNKASPIKWVVLVLSLLIVFAVKLLPPPAGLSDAGFQILGILAVAILLFLSWGVDWTSMFVFALLTTVPGLGAAKVTQATFGNSTAVFLLFCFMLAAALIKSGVARRIAIWFLTNKLARKSPWWTISMYFASVYILDLVLSSATCIMIFLPILLSIFESIGLDHRRDRSLSSMLLLGTVSIALLSNGTNPISHAVTIQGFSLYESYVGESMDFFTFSAVTTPVSLLSAAVIFLLMRFVWRPDVSAFTSIDYDRLAASCGAFRKKERWSLIIYLLCVLLWLLPGLSKYFWPTAYPMLSKINNCYPPLLALFVMNFVRVDGEKILDWGDAVKAVNWPTYLFIATIMGLGSFMGNADIGLSEWLSNAMAPAFSHMPPLVFAIIMVFAVDLLTNFCSNSVALSVVFAVALPLCMNLYRGLLSPMMLAILITSSAMNGWATPPATPTAAVAYSSGWTDNRQVCKWGLVFMLVQVVLCVAVGIPVANLLCR